MNPLLDIDALTALAECRNDSPFSLLGPKTLGTASTAETTVRAFLPTSAKAWLLDSPETAGIPMRRVSEHGLFEAKFFPKTNRKHAYQLRVEEANGECRVMHDPYAFPAMMSDLDLHLFGEGRHWEVYNQLGAHLRTVDGVAGVNFAVWAPNAQAVSVVGDFNAWDGRRHPMQKQIDSGIWELFIPGLPVGEKYKYRVVRDGGPCDKTDPYGFAAELPPRTASIVTDLSQFTWTDQDWLGRRAETNPQERPVSVYEVHLGSWRRFADGPMDWLGYRDLAHQLVEYCLEMGYTHVELLPVSEHPFTGSWGYQTVGYHAVTSRYGTPEDFMYFVNHCHNNGIGVILDWVPAHFPKDDHGLRQFDGTALYEHADPRQGEHPDWGTLIFNYDRNEVRNFLLANALFWLDKYHIDGLRVDAVASMLYLDYSREEGEWIPNTYGGRENLGAISLLQEFNKLVYERHPGVMTIAEESTAWGGVSRPTYDGGLGFTFKWNMGWMNDTLRYFHHEPIHRRFHHNELTFSMIYAFTENFVLPLSHDEVVHGKGSLLDQMPGDLWQKYANLRLLYTYMWTHPGKKLLFMGSDIAQWNEWNADENLQWDLLQWESHQGVQNLVKDLNQIYQSEPALHQVDFEPGGFEWVDCMSSETSVLAYLRRAQDPDDHLLICCNFTPVPREDYRVGVPADAWYHEIFNSDSQHYAGSNVGNGRGIRAEKIEAQGRPLSIQLTMPPLGVAIFKPER